MSDLEKQLEVLNKRLAFLKAEKAQCAFVNSREKRPSANMLHSAIAETIAQRNRIVANLGF